MESRSRAGRASPRDHCQDRHPAHRQRKTGCEGRGCTSSGDGGQAGWRDRGNPQRLAEGSKDAIASVSEDCLMALLGKAYRPTFVLIAAGVVVIGIAVWIL